MRPYPGAFQKYNKILKVLTKGKKSSNDPQKRVQTNGSDYLYDRASHPQ